MYLIAASTGHAAQLSFVTAQAEQSAHKQGSCANWHSGPNQPVAQTHEQGNVVSVPPFWQPRLHNGTGDV
jgi:hypothetical protein